MPRLRAGKWDNTNCSCPERELPIAGEVSLIPSLAGLLPPEGGIPSKTFAATLHPLSCAAAEFVGDVPGISFSSGQILEFAELLTTLLPVPGIQNVHGSRFVEGHPGQNFHPVFQNRSLPLPG